MKTLMDNFELLKKTMQEAEDKYVAAYGTDVLPGFEGFKSKHKFIITVDRCNLFDVYAEDTGRQARLL